jgi:transcriptional regulator with XRE-family HTH domain
MQDVSTRFLNRIGKNIKTKRQDKKLSLEELGHLTGLTRMQVHRIEKGYNITAVTLLKLSLALDVSLADLVKFETKSKKKDLEWLVDNNKVNKVR